MGLFQDDFEEVFSKKAWKGSGIVGALLIAYLGAAMFWSIWPFSVASGLAKQVTNPTAIIYNYEWYEEMYDVILATKANIKIAEQAANDAKSEEQKYFTSTNLTGIRMVLNQQIAEYNAKSREITRNLWKSDKLPYSIKLEDLE